MKPEAPSKLVITTLPDVLERLVADIHDYFEAVLIEDIDDAADVLQANAIVAGRIAAEAAALVRADVESWAPKTEAPGRYLDGNAPLPEHPMAIAKRQQRETALRRANQRRAAVASLKRAIVDASKADEPLMAQERWNLQIPVLCEALRGNSPMIGAARVETLLGLVWKFDDKVTAGIFSDVSIRINVRVRELSDRQRRALVEFLYNHYTTEGDPAHA